MGTTNNPQEHSRAKPQRSATANDFTSEGTKVGGLSLKQKLFRLKKVQTVQDNLDNNATENQFKKVLGTYDLISLGVGSCAGTGMYLVSGMVAKTIAGPAVVLSYTIAGFAALLSALCYAELGVRVPHTTGSAYVYTYVTVGEFVAFIIGWNMILEYIIGTASCACALSACFDILSRGAITNVTSAETSQALWSSDAQDNPPDILAFIITLLMMMIFFRGVKRSVMFNHIMNAINLMSCVIIVGFGLWFCRGYNWSPFMPFGLKGVVHGAATCFYAFIGFDIIATTGEETKNPRRSLPTSIISSLIIIMVAYISCSSIMTLIMPYNQLDERAGLVQIWGQIGYPVVQYFVSAGAVAALLASMFGSMFPMPRIAYAMAKDGLIFRFFATMNNRGVPACANFWLSLIAACCALYFSLEVLVEMMSIGTLLAYTLVDACVLILRYQHSRQQRSQPAFIELLQAPEAEKLARPNSQMEIMSPMDEFTQNVELESESGYFECFKKLMNGTHSTQMELNGVPISNKNPKMVLNLFFSSLISIVVFDILIVIAEDVIFNLFILFLIFVIGTMNVLVITMLAKFPQGRTVGFATPGVPITPILGIAINFYLMLRLSPLTLIRFTVWMVLGLVTYFKYGILSSRLEDETIPCMPKNATTVESNH